MMSRLSLRGLQALWVMIPLCAGHAHAATGSGSVQRAHLTGQDLPSQRGQRGPAYSGILVVETPAAQQQAAATNVSLEMIASRPIEVGSKVTFRITARKPGYLLLVDIDASGKMTQIFPNPELLSQLDNTDMNVLKPGETLVLPTAAAAARGFQYIISPPTGAAAVIAILSEKRVQLLDLPDLPHRLETDTDIANYVEKWINELRIPDTATGKLGANSWWLDVKSYVIK
ncbi:DUF4384 domain-containing protein [Rhodopseudomonas sp. P2A-2r]|uniref:DUF4384 domain-containing protein n=1 Tax=Rhodopseudomonas sp. P2A-2r TaxID=2991972 RepID=UPI0022345E26|nr:DUF4384 domain-containing protein [Rhodopseudomonas sp. P2A-2r]UZE49079.1 DUF4384 domain-containing protein [Rhodopseudomonas sp. P2A-2r]